MRKRMAKRKLREAVRRGLIIEEVERGNAYVYYITHYKDGDINSGGKDDLEAIDGLLFCMKDIEEDIADAIS